MEVNGQPAPKFGEPGFRIPRKPPQAPQAQPAGPFGASPFGGIAMQPAGPFGASSFGQQQLPSFGFAQQQAPSRPPAFPGMFAGTPQHQQAMQQQQGMVQGLFAAPGFPAPGQRVPGFEMMRQNMSAQTGIPSTNIGVRRGEGGLYGQAFRTGSHGQPQETHFSIHTPQGFPGQIGPVHVRTMNASAPGRFNKPRYQAMLVPQQGPGGTTMFVPQGVLGQQGQPIGIGQGFASYPQGHPAVPVVQAMAGTAGQVFSQYGQRGPFGPFGGKRGKKNRRTRHAKKSKKSRKVRK